MIEKVFIIAFIEMAIWATMWEDAIFEFVRKWGEKHLSEKLQKVTYDCPICGTFWYGGAAYWLIFHNSWQEWLIVVIAAMGVNTVFIKIFPEP